MRAIVVLVEPEYEENIGLIARVTKNFGFKDLWLVNPKANFLGPKAISRAMHARAILEKAKQFSSLNSVLEKVDFAAATTAIASKDKKIIRNAITPRELAENFKRTNAKLAIVFGREASGLTNEEIRACDFVVNIPTDPKYKTLNVSHAVAIVLYELYVCSKKHSIDVADSKTKRTMIKVFTKIVRSMPAIRNKTAVISSFKHLIARSPITKREANAVLAVLSEIAKEPNKPKKL